MLHQLRRLSDQAASSRATFVNNQRGRLGLSALGGCTRSARTLTCIEVEAGRSSRDKFRWAVKVKADCVLRLLPSEPAATSGLFRAVQKQQKKQRQRQRQRQKQKK